MLQFFRSENGLAGVVAIVATIAVGERRISVAALLS